MRISKKPARMLKGRTGRDLRRGKCNKSLESRKASDVTRVNHIGILELAGWITLNNTYQNIANFSNHARIFKPDRPPYVQRPSLTH